MRASRRVFSSLYLKLVRSLLVVTMIVAPFECQFRASGIALNGAVAKADTAPADGSEATLDPLLKSEWLNPFAANVNQADLQLQVHNLARQVSTAFTTVVEMENQLIRNEDALRSQGFKSPKEFLEAVAQAEDALPAEVKAAIKNSSAPHEVAERVSSGAAPFDGPEAARLRDLLSGAREQLSDHFQEKRIDHTKAYFRLAFGIGALNVYDIALEISRSGRSLDEASRVKYEATFARMIDSVKSYLQNESQYEGPKRNTVVIPHNDFLRSLKRVSALVEALEQTENTAKELSQDRRVKSETKSLSAGLFIYLKRFVVGVIVAPAVAFHASRLVWSVVKQQTYQPGQASTRAHGDLVISNSIMAITRLLTPVLGLKVEYEGVEHLASLPPDALKILTPTHRNALRDMVAVAALRFKNMALYANAGQILNMAFGRGDSIKILGRTINMLDFKRRVVGMVNRNPGVLVAGPTHNPDRDDANFKPVRKSVTLMVEGLRAALNYPHGALPSMLGVDLPVVESWFGRKATLAEAWRAGQVPSLAIATLPYNVDPLGLGLVPEYAQGRVKIRIDGVMPGELIKTVVAFGGESVLKHLFEANSNLGMVTSDYLHRGHIRTDALPEMIDRYMNRRGRESGRSTLSIRSCEALFTPAM